MPKSKEEKRIRFDTYGKALRFYQRTRRAGLNYAIRLCPTGGYMVHPSKFNPLEDITSMTYDLAKQLKDAGFLQKHGDKWSSWIETDNNGEEYYVPTLPELIEACGDKFDRMYLIGGIFYAWTQGDLIMGEGSTPEEAVAHLLLKLSNGNMREWMAKNTGIGKGTE